MTTVKPEPSDGAVAPRGLTTYAVTAKSLGLRDERDYTQPGDAPSRWCIVPRENDNHNWCANRDASETHCTCSCHKVTKVEVHLKSEVDARLADLEGLRADNDLLKAASQSMAKLNGELRESIKKRMQDIVDLRAPLRASRRQHR